MNNSKPSMEKQRREASGSLTTNRGLSGRMVVLGFISVVVVVVASDSDDTRVSVSVQDATTNTDIQNTMTKSITTIIIIYTCIVS